MYLFIDTTGNASIFNELLDLVRPSGYIVIPGFYEQELSNVKLDKIIAKDCTLIGAAGTPNMGRKILDMLENGLIELAPMITEHYPFEQAIEGFEAVKKHNDSRVKIMIDFDT